MSDSNDRSDRDQASFDNLTLVDDRGDYAILTINRPEKRNAMSQDAIARLRGAFREVRNKKVVVLTGTGTSFCAGVDLSEGQLQRELEDRQSSQERSAWTEVQSEIRAHPAVFIAAVNGYALGGGSTLINSCDLAIAAESASIGMPEMGFGGWPSQAGPAAVKRLAPKHAFELIFTSRRADAATAYRMALVNKVVPDSELLNEAIALAEHIAAFDAVALDWGKKAFQKIQDGLSWDDAQDYSVYVSTVSRMKSDAVSNGMADFVAGKRGPGQGA